MIKISRESEVNLINVLIDQDVISGKDLPNIKLHLISKIIYTNSYQVFLGSDDSFDASGF